MVTLCAPCLTIIFLAGGCNAILPAARAGAQAVFTAWAFATVADQALGAIGCARGTALLCAAVELGAAGGAVVTDKGRALAMRDATFFA